MKKVINRAFETVASNNIKVKSIIDELASVTAHNVACLDLSLRDQAKAEMVSLREGMDRLNSSTGGAATNVQLIMYVSSSSSPDSSTSTALSTLARPKSRGASSHCRRCRRDSPGHNSQPRGASSCRPT